MKFRPCIDIHNGKVKQIVGGSLRDKGDFAADNFVSEEDAGYYAALYRKAGLFGGHIILLNPPESRYYEENIRQACLALQEAGGTMQIGGGMNDQNASFFLDHGASHIIVTSFVFRDGKFQEERLKKICRVTGKKRLVLDLSCRKRDGKYYIVTDRWQKFTDVELNRQTLDRLSGYCDEFLIHAADVEGKVSGIEKGLVAMLGNWDGIPITYAGGIHSFGDLRHIKRLGHDKIDITVGSALDLFGGHMEFSKVLQYCKEQ